MAGFDPKALAAAANKVNVGGGDVSSVTSALMSDPGFMATFQNQLGDLIGKSSGYIQMLPKEVRGRINALKNIQTEYAVLDMKMNQEMQELEAKYAAQFAPLYKRRADIVSGAYEPTAEEKKFADPDADEDEEEEEAAAEGGEDDEPAKGIPNFWMTAFGNNETLSALVEEYDVEILECLQDVTATTLPDNISFALHFHFGENEYFSNTVLTKTVHLVQPGPESLRFEYEGPQYSRSEGTIINWKKDKDVTVKTVKKKQRKKSGPGAGKTRTVIKQEKQESFFNLFKSLTPPADDEEMDEEEADELSFQMSSEYEVCCITREMVIPKAVLWFTGEALQDDEEAYSDEEEGDDDEGDDDEDDDDMPRGGKKQPKALKAGGAADDDDDEDDPDFDPAKAGEQPPECKQS